MLRIVEMICCNQELFDFMCDDDLLEIVEKSPEVDKRVKDIASGKISTIDDPTDENDGNFADGFLYIKLPERIDEAFISNFSVESEEVPEILDFISNSLDKSETRDSIYKILKNFTPEQIRETVDFCPFFRKFLRDNYLDIFDSFELWDKSNPRYVPKFFCPTCI